MLRASASPSRSTNCSEAHIDDINIASYHIVCVHRKSRLLVLQDEAPKGSPVRNALPPLGSPVAVDQGWRRGRRAEALYHIALRAAAAGAGVGLLRVRG